MSGELEAAGALATAGAVTGAIEPGEPGAAGEGPCLNCGAQLAGRYCSNCGQPAHPHRTLHGMVGEFLSSLYNFDTKAWRTLPRLIFRPGTLTREYVFGKRARYVSPLAAFLLSIFLMFFAFSTIEMPTNVRDVASGVTAEDIAEAQQGLAQARAELADARAHPDADMPAGLEVRLAENGVRLAEAAVHRLEQQQARQQAREARRSAAQSQPGAAAPAAGDAAENAVNVGVSVDREAVQGNSTWQEELRGAVDRGEVHVNFGNAALNQRVLQTLRNPDLALYQIQDAFSKFSFLLAPLSLPFIALLFLWKRGVTFYDHMVYALYALAFAALLFSSVVLMSNLPVVGGAAGLLLCALPVHMYFQIGGAYALNWFSALWRTFFMLIFAILVASIFFTIVIVLGLIG
jgi:hypothetical protein